MDELARNEAMDMAMDLLQQGVDPSLIQRELAIGTGLYHLPKDYLHKQEMVKLLMEGQLEPVKAIETGPVTNDAR